MKKIKMERDFDYKPTPQRLTAYKGGKTYPKVPEAAAAAIVSAGAGNLVGEEADVAASVGESRTRRVRGR